MNRFVVSAFITLSLFSISSSAIAAPSNTRQMAPQARSGGSPATRKIVLGTEAKSDTLTEESSRAMLSTTTMEAKNQNKSTRRIPASRSGGSASARYIKIDPSSGTTPN